MTIKEAQELVDAWGDKHAIRHNELANMALLTEEIGKLARVMVRRYGEHAADPRFRGEATDEIWDILWALIGVANQTGARARSRRLPRAGRRDFGRTLRGGCGFSADFGADRKDCRLLGRMKMNRTVAYFEVPRFVRGFPYLLAAALRSRIAYPIGSLS